MKTLKESIMDNDEEIETRIKYFKLYKITSDNTDKYYVFVTNIEEFDELVEAGKFDKQYTNHIRDLFRMKTNSRDHLLGIYIRPRMFMFNKRLTEAISFRSVYYKCDMIGKYTGKDIPSFEFNIGTWKRRHLIPNNDVTESIMDDDEDMDSNIGLSMLQYIHSAYKDAKLNDRNVKITEDLLKKFKEYFNIHASTSIQAQTDLWLSNNIRYAVRSLVLSGEDGEISICLNVKDKKLTFNITPQSRWINFRDVQDKMKALDANIIYRGLVWVFEIKL